MTLAEEKIFLDRFAEDAGAGQMLNIQEIKAAYEKAIRHETSNSTIYALLDRHGWRKLMPRPFHPKRDIAAQNAFKKRGFLMLSGKPGWLPPSVVAACASCSPTKRASAE
jgi:hypothetical protein